MAPVAGDGLAAGVVVAAALAGLRHGFDIDHIAAIGDIAAAEPRRRRALALMTAYAGGHIAVVLALGTAAVAGGAGLPPSWDAIAQRVIGVTLVALGAYVLYRLARFPAEMHLVARGAVLLAGLRWLARLLRHPRTVVIDHDHPHDHSGSHGHEHPVEPAPQTAGAAAAVKTRHSHPHSHVALSPVDPLPATRARAATVIGALHGVGAETPTQVLLFATAAGVAGSWGGVALLLAFGAGLLAGNTVLALVALAGSGAGRRVKVLYPVLAGATAACSIYVGAAYLLQRQPSLLGWLAG